MMDNDTMYIKEKRYDDTRQKVYVEVYMDTAPAAFPATGQDLDGDGGVRDNYTFETGSIIYIVGTGEVYMAKSDGTWVQQ